jgi:hypothetical protein
MKCHSTKWPLVLEKISYFRVWGLSRTRLLRGSSWLYSCSRRNRKQSPFESPEAQKVKLYVLPNRLKQGFSNFWYLRTPKSKLDPSAYPQIRLVSPSRTPKSKILPKWPSFGCFFYFAHPLRASQVPLGVRKPQVENCWSKGNYKPDRC